jgi:hypothetical protein
MRRRIHVIRHMRRRIHVICRCLVDSLLSRERERPRASERASERDRERQRETERVCTKQKRRTPDAAVQGVVGFPGFWFRV